MFKEICLVALFAVASAQNWEWQRPNPLPPTWDNQQNPNWNVPQFPSQPEPQPDCNRNQPSGPNWSIPSNRPTYPINTQGHQGVPDGRCPARSNSGSFIVLFPHDQQCSQYFVCNHGLRCKMANFLI